MIWPKKAVILVNVVKKKPKEKRKKGIALYKMNTNKSLMPSNQISDLFSHVGSPMLPIIRSLETFDKYPSEKKFAPGIYSIMPPAIHLSAKREVIENRIKGIISIAISLS